jgi:uncharacterized protein (TIGR00369 family)
VAQEQGPRAAEQGAAGLDQRGGDNRRPALSGGRPAAARIQNGAGRDAQTLSEPETRTRTLTWQDPLPAAAAGAEMSGIDYMRAIVAGEIPPPPIAMTMRMGPIEIEEGRAVFEGEPGEEHYNPIGVVHGGYAATLLDSALGCSVHTTLPAGVGYTSLGLEVKYVRPITRDTGRVICEAEVVYRGRRQATSEARLTADGSGKLLAHGAATCMLLT